MTITIDELCERLGITQAISEEEYPKYKRAAVPYDLQAKWYDRRSLPSTKAVASIVCEQLQGVETAVELGAGTGFRVLYYAINNPTTTFLAIDNDRNATDQLKERIRKLRVPNLRVQTGDMYGLKEKYAAILAIDCFFYPSEDNAIIQWGASCMHFGRLVDTSKNKSFLCVPFYDQLGSSYGMTELYAAQVFQEVGLGQLETVPFEFVQRDGAYWNGKMLLAKP